MAGEIPQLLEPRRRPAPADSAVAPAISVPAGRAATPRPGGELEDQQELPAAMRKPAPRASARALPGHEQQRLKSTVHQELIKRLDLDKLGIAQETRSGQQQLLSAIQQIVGEQGVPLSGGERDRLAKEVLDEVFGLGPLEPLLQDDTISDILVNTFNQVYVERRGMLEPTAIAFKDNRHLLHIIDKIVSAVGRRIDESSPMVDARLKDGSRVNAIIPPAGDRWAYRSPSGALAATPLTAEDLLRNKAMSPPMLRCCCARRCRRA